MLINLIIWLVIGFVAGYLAKLIMPGPDGGGIIMTTILGIVGAMVGGFIGRTFFESAANINDNNFSIMSLVFAVIGAIIVLAIYRLATGRSVTS
ncbi:MAG: GlsB/YeaQ/YmgE family stress response membrane protein [Acidobacteriota bacterium]|nr:GlsB/YeaQ/YmgE family stress response membrane protein [Acidobacteriota bacterium]